jgi:hypothetical protein
METLCPRNYSSFCRACLMFRLPVDHQFYVKFAASLYSVCWEFPTSNICLAWSDQFTINDDTYLTFDVYQNTRRYGTAKRLATDMG